MHEKSPLAPTIAPIIHRSDFHCTDHCTNHSSKRLPLHRPLHQSFIEATSIAPTIAPIIHRSDFHCTDHCTNHSSKPKLVIELRSGVTCVSALPISSLIQARSSIALIISPDHLSYNAYLAIQPRPGAINVSALPISNVFVVDGPHVLATPTCTSPLLSASCSVHPKIKFSVVLKRRSR
jgi:hypothetical protein